LHYIKCIKISILKHWREVNTAYCAHDNLIEGASTGQKQLAKIDNVLKTKKKVAIFLFDEADNALDSEKQTKFSQQLENLGEKETNHLCWARENKKEDLINSRN